MDQEVLAEARLDEPTSIVTLERPIAIKRRGVEMKIVLDDPAAANQVPDQTLVDGIAKAHYALRMLTDGSAQ